MSGSETQKRLEAITHAGLFERLATAVLRAADHRCRLLAHAGVNVDGKTVRSPVDGIVFAPGSDPPHMIAVHHTTCARDELERKWLHDPAAVPGRTGSAVSAGDVVKTIKLVNEQRTQMPSLQATLILTTNQEPAEDLVRRVNTAAADGGGNVELWPRSALAHFLDSEGTGQWLRREFFGIVPRRLGPEPLRELSLRSLEWQPAHEGPEMWIERCVEKDLGRLKRDVTFVMAGSGHGKTVVCTRLLGKTIDAGGYGLVLPHEAIADAPTLDRAVEIALRKLSPESSTRA